MPNRLESTSLIKSGPSIEPVHGKKCVILPTLSLVVAVHRNRIRLPYIFDVSDAMQMKYFYALITPSRLSKVRDDD